MLKSFNRLVSKRFSVVSRHHLTSYFIRSFSSSRIQCNNTSNTTTIINDDTYILDLSLKAYRYPSEINNELQQDFSSFPISDTSSEPAIGQEEIPVVHSDDKEPDFVKKDKSNITQYLAAPNKRFNFEKFQKLLNSNDENSIQPSNSFYFNKIYSDSTIPAVLFNPVLLSAPQLLNEEFHDHLSSLNNEDIGELPLTLEEFTKLLNIHLVPSDSSSSSAIEEEPLQSDSQSNDDYTMFQYNPHTDTPKSLAEKVLTPISFNIPNNDFETSQANEEGQESQKPYPISLHSLFRTQDKYSATDLTTQYCELRTMYSLLFFVKNNERLLPSEKQDAEAVAAVNTPPYSKEFVDRIWKLQTQWMNINELKKYAQKRTDEDTEEIIAEEVSSETEQRDDYDNNDDAMATQDVAVEENEMVWDSEPNSELELLSEEDTEEKASLMEVTDQMENVDLSVEDFDAIIEATKQEFMNQIQVTQTMHKQSTGRGKEIHAYLSDETNYSSGIEFPPSFNDIIDHLQSVDNNSTIIPQSIVEKFEIDKLRLESLTAEDGWAVKFLTMVMQLRQLRQTGEVRELYVFGQYKGHLLTGYIDYLYLDNTSLSSSSSSSSSTSFVDNSFQKTDNNDNQTLLIENTRKSGKGGFNPDLPKECQQLVIVDTKTRKSDRIKVPESQTVSAYHQVLLYHYMLTQLLSRTDFSFDKYLVSKLGLDPETQITPGLISMFSETKIKGGLFKSFGESNNNDKEEVVITLKNVIEMLEKELDILDNGVTMADRVQVDYIFQGHRKLSKPLKFKSSSSLSSSVKEEEKEEENVFEKESIQQQQQQKEEEEQQQQEEQEQVSAGFVTDASIIKENEELVTIPKSQQQQQPKESSSSSSSSYGMPRLLSSYEYSIHAEPFSSDGDTTNYNQSSKYPKRTLQLLDHAFSFWQNSRDPLGVPHSQLNKCRYCNFAQVCKWQKEL